MNLAHVAATVLACLLLAPQLSLAWTGDVHAYLCPEGIDCNIADDYRFKTSHRFGQEYHLCYDNSTECMPRLVAKYYLKEYYAGGRNPEMLGAAAHLFQDSYCPDHWYPMRELFGRIFVPFAPDWVGKTEGFASAHKNDNSSYAIGFRGRAFGVGREYLDGIKAELTDFLSQEPVEDIGDLESAIRSRQAINSLRMYSEWLLVWIAIALAYLAYVGFRWFRKGFRSVRAEAIITVVTLAVLLVVYLLIAVLY